MVEHHRQVAEVEGVAHLLLHDRFSDQVNVVRASDGRRNTTLLFLRGDGPKPLP